MALQKQTIGIDFVGGLDTKTDEKLVEAPFLTRLENGVFTRKGSVKKRNGFQSINKTIFPTPDDITSGTALGLFDGELLLFSDDEIYSRTVNSNAWIDKGPHCSMVVGKTQIMRNSEGQGQATVATCGDTTLYAWEDNRGGVRSTALDRITGAQYYSDEDVSNTANVPRAIAVGTNIVTFFQEDISGLLRTMVVSCDGPDAVGPIGTYATNFEGTYDVDETGLYGRAGIAAWRDNANNLRMAFVTPTGFVGGVGTFPAAIIAVVGGANTITHIGVRYMPLSGNIVLLVNLDGVSIRALTFSPAFLLLNDVVITAVPLQTTGAVGLVAVQNPDGNIEVYFDQVNNGPLASARIFRTTLGPTGALLSGPVQLKTGGILAGKPFFVGTRIVVMISHVADLQGSYFAIDGITATIFGRWLYGLSQSTIPSTSPPPGVPMLSTGIWLFPGLEKGRLRSIDGNVFTPLGVTAITLDFTTHKPDIEQVGRNTLMSGGVIRAYDAYGFTELGFLTFPEDIAQPTLVAPLGGPGLVDGLYGYRFVYEWTDNQGQIDRSAPSPIVLVDVLGGPRGVDFSSIATPLLTDKFPPNRQSARLVVYRTLTNGNVFFSTQQSFPLDPATGFIAFNDSNDNSIESNEILYTVGGELENDAGPSSTILLEAKDRVWLAGTEDGQLWYSKKFVDGDRVSFSLGQRIKPEGVITALAEMDDKLVVFEQSRIFIISGDGPNALGEQDSFTPMQLVSTDVGCIDNRSVVEMSLGVMFQSQKGIYLITRALESLYIGAPVEKFNGQEITASTLVEDVNQVRFLVSSGVTLLYDYLFNSWGTWTNYTGVCAAQWVGTYAHLKPSGQVYLESEGYYLDEYQSIPLIIETAWIKLAGVQGFKRIYRVAVLGDFRTPHKLRFKVAFDYQPYIDQELIWDTLTGLPQFFYGTTSPYGADPVYGSTNDAVYQFRSKLCRQKCESVKFGFEDVSVTPGEAYILTNIALEVGVKMGLFKMPPQKTI